MELEEYEKIAKEYGLYLVIIHPNGNKNLISVMDNDVDYELDDKYLVTKKRYSYTEIERVLKIAKELALKVNKEYIPFYSRFCSFTEEKYFNTKTYEKLIEEIEGYI